MAAGASVLRHQPLAGEPGRDAAEHDPTVYLDEAFDLLGRGTGREFGGGPDQQGSA